MAQFQVRKTVVPTTRHTDDKGVVSPSRSGGLSKVPNGVGRVQGETKEGITLR